MDDATARAWDEVPQEFAEGFGDEGDTARRLLLNPALFELLGDVRGRAILDAGCGQGYLARLLARRGATVTGIEPSGPLIEYALRHERETPLGVTYLRLRLDEYTQAGTPFDTVVANMVLMDIPDWQRALGVCFDRLRAGGLLVCSLAHPCFEGADGEYAERGTLAVAEYFAEYTIPQRWGARFHRPLSAYMAAILQRGALRAMIEPRLPLPNELAAGQQRNADVPGFVVLAAAKK